MRKFSLLLLVAMLSNLSLGLKKASAAEVVVVRDEAPRRHYVHRDGYYWDGPHAYRRIWIARSHRYEYRPVVVERSVVVVHDHDRR